MFDRHIRNLDFCTVLIRFSMVGCCIVRLQGVPNLVQKFTLVTTAFGMALLLLLESLSSTSHPLSEVSELPLGHSFASA